MSVRSRPFWVLEKHFLALGLQAHTRCIALEGFLFFIFSLSAAVVSIMFIYIVMLYMLSYRLYKCS